MLMLANRFSGVDAPGPLTIRVTRDGTFRVGEEPVTIPETVERAQATQAQRQNVYVCRDYPREEATPEAVALCEALLGRGVLFQEVDGTPADRG